LLFQVGAIDRDIEVLGQHPHVQVGIQQPVGILVDEGLHAGRQVAARITVQETHQTEIVEADAAVLADEQVAGMGVAVEQA